ncbi:MAG TPA: hypothetical protein VGB85_12700, partial [Nannocystis sp.]
PEHHYVTWSRRQGDHMRDSIARHRDLAPAAAADLHRLLNQSVLLVPIPCALPEAEANDGQP